MDGLLKIGYRLISDSGREYVVKRLIGSGGQGEVYEAFSDGKSYALKWYFKHTATVNQKNILKKLIEKGAPDEVFLWPMDLISPDKSSSFGYIMPLRPSNYKSIVDMMKRKAEPGFYELTRAAYNLTKGYNMLHNAGYQYRDISFSNVFFNPDNGDVLICDNDNVVPNGDNDGNVYGTPRFMAPEIVRGEKKPSRNTDLYSLAVLLFYMFMLNHPLEGALEAEIRCMDIHAMNKLYGTSPVFIWDPEDCSNRPVAGYQDNAILFWDLYPDKLKKLFTKSFTEGLTVPAKRVTENKWLECFAEMLSGIMACPKCHAEVFYDRDKYDKGDNHICWACGNAVTPPVMMYIGKSRITITSRTKIYAHHLNHDNDMNRIVGEVVINPNNPAKWGIRNRTGGIWKYIRADKSEADIEPLRAAAIVRGAAIDFGNIRGEFI